MTDALDLIGVRCLHTSKACDVKLGELILATNSDGESVLIKVEPETCHCDGCYFGVRCPPWPCGARGVIFVKVEDDGCN